MSNLWTRISHPLYVVYAYLPRYSPARLSITPNGLHHHIHGRLSNQVVGKGAARGLIVGLMKQDDYLT